MRAPETLSSRPPLPSRRGGGRRRAEAGRSGAGWRGGPVVLILAIVVLVAARTFAPHAAEAHALLVRADPPVNSQLRAAPAQMSLYFSEAVERKISTIHVLDSDRKRVETGVEFDDQDNALMRVNLGPMAPGYYTVTWETLSRVDGHRIAGQYPITVLNQDGSLPPGTNPAATGVTATVSGVDAKPDRVVTKWALLLAGSVLTGAMIFTWVIGGISGDRASEAREAACRGIVLAAAAALLVLAIAGLAELLLQADAVFGSAGKFPDVISSTRWGQRWVLRNSLLLPLALGVLALHRQRLDSRVSRYVLAALIGLSLAYLAVSAMVSHAAAGTGAFWATASDFVHLVAASVWIGMLLQVVLLVRWAGRHLPRAQQPAVIASALRRFSLIAVGSVALLLFTGVINSVIELNRPADLLDTGYGRALLIKLILIVPLLIAGAMNAYLFRPQVVEEAERAESGRRGGVSGGWEDLERTLARTVRVEAGLASLVLLVVAVLVQLAPARSALAAPSPAGKFTETRQVSGLGVTLNIDPNQPGTNTFEAYLTGDAINVERVRLLFLEDKKDAFQSELILDQSPTTPLYFVGSGPFINDPGRWKVTVDLRRGAGSTSDLSVPFDVKVSAPGGVASASRAGGAFESPRSFSTAGLALIVAAGALSAGLFLASLDKPGRAAGLMGDWADRVATIEIRPGFSLAALVLVGIGLGILVGTHGHNVLSSKEAKQGNPVASSPASIEKGRTLFIQNCIQCHGESGRGDGPLAPSLRIPPANLYDHVPYHPDEFFFSIITNGYSGIMPAFGSSISEEDRWNILNFLRDQFGQAPAAK